MKRMKKIVNRIKCFLTSPDPQPLSFFYTKDIFRDKKYIIGDYTYGKPRVLFENDEANLIIGKFCSIADEVTIFLGGNHRTDWITTYPFNVLNSDFPEASQIEGHPATKGDVIIGNDVWIGRGVIIMSGITIGDGAVIAAGSVVSRNVGDYEIWGGNPSKLLKMRFECNAILKLQKLKWWDWEISRIKDNIECLCSNNLDKI
jgi:acetyltransferase-like isoleucine patch superfamily enzyme